MSRSAIDRRRKAAWPEAREPSPPSTYRKIRLALSEEPVDLYEQPALANPTLRELEELAPDWPSSHEALLPPEPHPSRPAPRGPDERQAYSGVVEELNFDRATPGLYSTV